MKPNLSDHNVESLFIRPLAEIEDPYDLYHDYAQNATYCEVCDFIAGQGAEPMEQSRSPGIVLIVEIEDVTLNQTSDEFPIILTKTLEEVGLHPISSRQIHSNNENQNSIVSIVMSEGYIITRAFPKLHYCALDIHFWSSLDKHEDTKNALVATMKGIKTTVAARPPTSFRVIAGGMFGVPTWRDDERNRGPHYDEICDQLLVAGSPQRPNDNETCHNYNLLQTQKNKNITDIAIMEIMNLLNDGQDLKVALLCGPDNKDASCEKSHRILTSASSIQKVEILSCPALTDFNEYASDASETITSCEKNILQTLKISSLSDGKFHALLVDESTDKFTSSVLHRILTSRRPSQIRHKVFMPEVLFLTINDEETFHTSSEGVSATDEGGEEISHRRNLLKRIKEKVFDEEPSYYSEISLHYHDGNHTTKLYLLSDGDVGFIRNLSSTMGSLQKKSGIVTSIDLIHGGYGMYQDNFVPSQHFLPDDFNHTAPYKQWKSQRPLGYQVIIQMEPLPTEIDTDTSQETKQTHPPLKLSASVVREALTAAIQDDENIEEYTDIGDGSLHIDMWAGGSIVVLWNGRDHVDVNLFTFAENFEQAKLLQKHLERHLRDYNLSTVLRDEHPRGLGGVLLFQKDLAGESDPHWA